MHVDKSFTKIQARVRPPPHSGNAWILGVSVPGTPPLLTIDHDDNVDCGADCAISRFSRAWRMIAKHQKEMWINHDENSMLSQAKDVSVALQLYTKRCIELNRIANAVQCHNLLGGHNFHVSIIIIGTSHNVRVTD